MRAALCVLLVVLVSAALAKPSRKHFEARFGEFKSRFNKVYATQEEEDKRKEIVKEEVDRIDEINEAHANNDLSWHADLTSQIDKTVEERRKMNGYVPASNSRVKRTLTKYTDSTNGVSFYKYTAGTNITVTQTNLNLTLYEGVLDQGQCGDCYSFATGSVISGYYCLKLKQNVIPSREDISACSKTLGNGGCNGGDPRLALTYVLKNKVATWSEYPYENATYTSGILPACSSAERTPTLLSIPSFTQINGDDLSMKYALTQCGPMVAAMYVNSTSGGMYKYAGGIYDGTTVINGVKINECSTTSVNHAITIVGFGTDATTGVQYWIIKNSWSYKWGIGGYFKLKMGTCGINTVIYTICPNGIY